VLLRSRVNDSFTQSRSAAGSRNIMLLMKEDGLQIERFKVRTLMREMNFMSAALATQDIGRYLMQQYDWRRPHRFNQGSAPAVAEEKLNAVSGIS
jgi:hypothetical protein